jgi:deoxyribodipyrimidine photolyase
MEKMTELTKSTLVKHVVMDKRTINIWLCAMLIDTDDVKNCAAIFILICYQSIHSKV